MRWLLICLIWLSSVLCAGPNLPFEQNVYRIIATDSHQNVFVVSFQKRFVKQPRYLPEKVHQIFHDIAEKKATKDLFFFGLFDPKGQCLMGLSPERFHAMDELKNYFEGITYE